MDIDNCADDFCDKVEAKCKAEYGIEDGGSLCFNLLEMEVISEEDGVDAAARAVAMHVQQA